MRKLGLLRCVAVGIVLVCSACASVSEVTPVGKDTYTVGSSVNGGFTSWAEVKAMAVRKADAHCTGMGKHVVVLDTKTHGARGWTPQEAEVTFRCLAEDDPEYQRPEVTK